MKKFSVKIISLLLAVMMLTLSSVSALAAGKVVSDEQDRINCTAFINESLNKIKTEKPYAVMTYVAGVPEGGMTVVNQDGEEELDETAEKYLLPMLDGLFNSNSSIAKSFIQTLFGEDVVRANETVLHRTMSRNKSVPVFGKDYVSNLDAADIYTIIADYDENATTPNAVKVVFRDYTLAEAKESAIADMFSLPAGDLDPIIISGSGTKTESFLSDVKITEFNIKDATVQVAFDEKGLTEHYRSIITYDVGIGYLDAIKLISAILGYDLYQAFINTYTTIAKNLGKSEDEIEEVLSEYRINVDYTVVVDITDFNWEPRCFGDVSDDNKLSAADARSVLRHVVGAEYIADAYNLVYADVNFDGEVDAADARLIMRMAVGLETPFSDVPEGSSVTIVDFSQQEEEETDTSEDEDTEKEDYKGILDGKFNPTVKLADIAAFVFDAINGVEEAEGEVMTNIKDLIEIIRGIVKESRENN